MTLARLTSLLVLSTCSAALAEPADRKVDKHPAVEPLTPEESMQRMRLPPGFRVELVASEPMIREPVALSWDGNGRMFVVEMRGYMQDIDGTGAKDPVGRISRLEDTDGDGLADKHSVFLDGLVEPRAVLAVGDGVLVGEPSDLWHCRDTDGDGKADTKERVYDRFSLRDSNVEHKANSLVWGIDNWIHVSQHGRRYQVIGGKFHHERVPSIGQWGLARDDAGRFLFSGNSNPAIALFVPPRYLGSYKDASKVMTGAIRRSGDYSSVWPAMVTPDLQSGAGAARPGDGTLRGFTSACGQTFFRGDRLGDGINGDYFICEPVGRIVRRSKVTYTDSGHIELTNRYESDLGEFVSSTDGNFRPVNCYTGPDGCLYIVDMYHGIIQERSYITPYLRGEILKAGYDKNTGRGRIYRIVREGVKPGPTPELLDANPAELVKHLAHPNGWWRDTAQSLLVTRQTKTVSPALREMALQHAEPLARLHALWTLDGLGTLDDETTFALAKDAVPRIRAAAVRSMESRRFDSESASYHKSLQGMVGDPSPLVIAQIILTAGQRQDEASRKLIAKCRAAHGKNELASHALLAMSQRGPDKHPVLTLSKEDRALFDTGKVIYQELCTACHGSDGRGVKAADGKALLAPPLPGSQRLQKDREAPIQIMLHGLIGELDGEKYEGLMAPFGATNNDDWVASVLTYVRREWGNKGSTILPSNVAAVREKYKDRQKPWTQAELELARETEIEPVFFVADGLNADGSLVKFYKRGLDYAINYFGNYGPYYVYLLGSESEQSVRAIYRNRAKSRVNPNAEKAIREKQVTEFLHRPNIKEEIDAVLAGRSEGGLTWEGPPQRVYEDVTTNATGREMHPIENTWGALHEYHHVFQVAHCEPYQERTSDRNFCSWMAEGMATYSSAKFMENLGLVDFTDYMLQLRKTGGNVGRPGINEFLAKKEDFHLDNESYWEEGSSAQVYYMLGAWATAYLIHVQDVEEVTVLKNWYFDILRIGKSAAFEKHMGISLEEFYLKFDAFIRQSDDEVMKIFARPARSETPQQRSE